MQIINRFTKKVIYESEKETIKETLIEAVGKKTNLGGANLRGANLRDADLGGANLRGADLGGAYLGGAYLGDAYFYQTKIKKSQTEQFLKEIGIVVEE